MRLSRSVSRQWLSVVSLLLFGTFAHADAVLDPDRVVRQRLAPRDAVASAALTFPLRPSATPARLDVEVRAGDKVVITEKRVPRAGAQTVGLFAAGGSHLDILRQQDRQKPGRVTVHVWQDGMLTVETSLTDFYARYGDRATRDVATDGACEDACYSQYSECIQYCDPQGQQCDNCWISYSQCTSQCPTCDDWVEVSRTRIGREYTGSTVIFGVQYCDFEEFYLVEETNPAGCYANRTVCDTDDDMIFYGFGTWNPTEELCCNDDPEDENYCGGTTCS